LDVVSVLLPVPPPVLLVPLVPLAEEPPVPVVVAFVFWPCPPLRLARQLLNSSANLR
jgi:hypothetical protein